MMSWHIHQTVLLSRELPALEDECVFLLQSWGEKKPGKEAKQLPSSLSTPQM